jgi:RNA recognition motif-containing protein
MGKPTKQNTAVEIKEKKNGTELLSLKKTIEKKKKKNLVLTPAKKAVIQDTTDLKKKKLPLKKKDDDDDDLKKKKLLSTKKDDDLKKKKLKKKKGPVSAKMAEANAKARMSIATGELANSEAERKKQQDLRTLYIRFKEDFPTSDAEIAEIHPKIKNVRYPRQARVNKKTQIKYAFIEFSSVEECEAAKKTLSTKQEKFYVDFVGEKSKNVKNISKKSKRPINPVRLFVNGLGPGVNPETLKQLFPKCKSADIPAKRERSKKSSSTFGFVEFQSPADAKAAFDAAKDLNVGGHHITVLYARIPNKRKNKEETSKKKKQDEEIEDDDSEDITNKRKRKKNDDEKPLKKKKQEEEIEDDDDDSEEIENDSDDEEVENDSDDEEIENDSDDEGSDQKEIVDEEDDDDSDD